MIVEHEVIEQIEEEPDGRPLTWVADLLRSLGGSDPFVVLHRMWEAGYVALVDQEGSPMPQWRCVELFRKNESAGARVIATEAGSRWVHGH